MINHRGFGTPPAHNEVGRRRMLIGLAILYRRPIVMVCMRHS